MRTLIALLLVCPSVFAADASVEERLAKLEAEVHALQVENQQLRAMIAPAAQSKPQPVNAQAAASESKLHVGGMIQAQAEAGGAVDSRYTDNNARVFLRRARLSAAGEFAEHFDFKAEIDMTGSIGGASGLRAQLTDGYVTWIPTEAFNLRIGQIKTPFGFEQLYSDSRLYTPERTLGSDRLTPGRQIGVSAFGTLSNRWTYGVGAFNGNGTNTTANDNNRFLFAGRLAGSLWEGKLGTTATRISAGVNGFTTHDNGLLMPAEFGFRSNSFTGDRNGAGVDLQAVAGPVEIWTEWLRDRFDPESGTPFTSFDAEAASILAAYNVRPEKLQLVVRFDRYKPDTRLGSATTSWDGGANYLLRGHDLKLQLHFVRGETAGVAHDRVIARVQSIF